MPVLLFVGIVSEPPVPFNPDDSWACTNPVYVWDRDADGLRPAGPLRAPLAVAHAGNSARVVEAGRGGAAGRGTYPRAGAYPQGGYAYAQSGDYARGTALIEDGLNEKIALRSNIALPWFCHPDAGTYLAAGQAQNALEIAKRGVDSAAAGGGRLFEPENHRIQGVILARDAGANAREIDGHLHEAFDLDRRRKAKPLELRAAMSLLRCATERSEREPGLTMVSSIYASFTEGLDTLALRDAGALLDRTE